ncbi:MAG: transposase [Desulfomonilaceae bacterium]
MFRENKGFQLKLISGIAMMSSKLKEKLAKSWAGVFYEQVFSKIDEKPFAVLYCDDNGRPNIPVNILLSFEIIKNLKDYTDADLLDQITYNLQIIHAIGGQDAGDVSFSPSTLYEFRNRVYRYTMQNPDKESLIFGQFTSLTDNFIKVAGISTKEQRMDSTQIMTNIKLGGRLSLAYDVLEQAIETCPEDLLTESHKNLLDPKYRTNTLYHTKGNEARMQRLQEMINLGAELLDIVESRSEICEKRGIAILRRFISEQAYFESSKKTWIIKDNKDIAANSLQSAYDEDVTYRKKAGKGHVGLVANLSETCAKENPVQMIVDYTVEKNIKGDTEMLEERIDRIKERTGLTDLNIDGGYFAGSVEAHSRDIDVQMHYTNMTGSEPNSQKVPLTSFVISNHNRIEACPQGYAPISCHFNNKNKVILAYFSLDHCLKCPFRNACPVQVRKNNAVLRVDQSKLFTEEAREKVQDKDAREQAGRKRAAIEGTNSALKRAQGAGKLKVRGIVKARLVIGLKVIGRNFSQLVNFFNGNTRNKYTKKPNRPRKGVIAPI